MRELNTEEQRRRAIAWAVALTTDTALAPQAYEQELLEYYAQSTLTLQQVLDQLDQRVQHVLYRSQARYPLTAQQLIQLVEQSQRCNEQHQVTGLLCYSRDALTTLPLLRQRFSQLPVLVFSMVDQVSYVRQVLPRGPQATCSRARAGWNSWSLSGLWRQVSVFWIARSAWRF